jgi:hypothetical protein
MEELGRRLIGEAAQGNRRKQKGRLDEPAFERLKRPRA